MHFRCSRLFLWVNSSRTEGSLWVTSSSTLPLLLFSIIHLYCLFVNKWKSIPLNILNSLLFSRSHVHTFYSSDSQIVLFIKDRCALDDYFSVKNNNKKMNSEKKKKPQTMGLRGTSFCPNSIKQRSNCQRRLT